MNTILEKIQNRIGAGEIWAFAAALAYSMDNLFTAYAVRGEGINFYLGASLRSLPVLILSLLVTLFHRKSSTNERRVSPLSDIRLILALSAYGLLAFFLGNTMFFSALQKGGVMVSTPLVGTQALWAAGFAVLLLGEGLNWKMIAGMIASIVGITILAMGKSGGIGLAPKWGLAIPLALGAAACWALSNVLVAYAQRQGVNRFHSLLFALVVGNLALNAYMLLTGQIDAYVVTPARLMGNVFLAGLFAMVALISITTAVGLTSLASATTLLSLQVGLAPLLASLFLQERMNLTIGAGIVLIMTGVIIVQLHRTIPEQKDFQLKVDTLDTGEAD